MRTLLIAAAAFAAPAAALACSCIGHPDAAAQLAMTDVMFVGTAQDTAAEGQGEDVRAVTRFRIDRGLKGQSSGVVSIAHPAGSSAACGIAFEAGKSYVVLASRNQGRLSTSLCQQAQFPLADYERVLGAKAGERGR